MRSCGVTIRRLVTVIYVLVVIELAYILLGLLVTNKIVNHSDQMMEPVQNEMKPVQNERSRMVDSPEICKVYDVALTVRSPRDARAAGMMLKTLFYHRKSPIRLHIIVSSSRERRIMKTLMETWELNQVQFDIHQISSEYNRRIPDTEWQLLKFKILKYVSNSVEQLLFIGNEMRLMEDIGLLWETIEYELSKDNRKLIGLPKNFDRESLTERTSPDTLIFYDLNGLRRSWLAARLDSFNTLNEVFSELSRDGTLFFHLPFDWTIHLTELINSPDATEDFTKKPAKGIVWYDTLNGNTWNPFVEELKEQITAMLGSEPLTHKTLNCYHWAEQSQPFVNINDSCYRFRRSGVLVRRTHLYYCTSDDDPVRDDHGEHDISLLTQLSLDRFSALEMMVVNWQGPVSVVLYLSDAEAVTLPRKIQSSSVLSRRRNIVYHVVYKRQDLYPVNYLRNVALNETRTPFAIYVDVDLLPSSKLHAALETLIRGAMFSQPKSRIALVVAAFEARPELVVGNFTDTVHWPENKKDLIYLMYTNRVWPFRFHDYRRGHEPTNYSNWLTATHPYKIPFRYGYEPYILLRTDSMPRYHEMLIDRVANKRAYTHLLYKMGYEFFVLPDEFLLHVWHPETSAAVTSKRDENWSRCGREIWHEYLRAISTINVTSISN